MRRRLGLTIENLSHKSQISHSAISRIERDETRAQPWILGRLLPVLASQFKNAFPETKGDPYNFLFPPRSFGSWLRNLRIRHGPKVGQLAGMLSVKPFTIIRYEANLSKPKLEIRERIRRALKLNGDPDRYPLPIATTNHSTNHNAIRDQQ